VDPESIRGDLGESLQRLRTDYIDLYLLHRDDPAVPVGPIIEVLNQLRAAGRIILFGASNWSRERLEQAQEYAQRNGLSSFSVSSNQYSLAVQHDAPFPGTLSINTFPGDPEWEWYQKTQFPLLSWSSLARGFFSGKFTRDNLADFADRQSRISIRCYAREDNFLRLDRARELAGKRGSSVAQIALAYVFHQPLNCFAITGSVNPAHLRESVGALDVRLTERELAWLGLRADSPA
jgi:aryl-alcohol dehydrogenase-like predicted oxidoreductase